MPLRANPDTPPLPAAQNKFYCIPQKLCALNHTFPRFPALHHIGPAILFAIAAGIMEGVKCLCATSGIHSHRHCDVAGNPFDLNIPRGFTCSGGWMDSTGNDEPIMSAIVQVGLGSIPAAGTPPDHPTTATATTGPTSLGRLPSVDPSPASGSEEDREPDHTAEHPVVSSASDSAPTTSTDLESEMALPFEKLKDVRYCRLALMLCA